MFHNLDEAEFEITGVRFRINKLNALDGWRMMERIRAQFSKTDMPEMAGGGDDVMQSVLKAVLSIDPDFTESIRSELFKKIEYKTEEVTAGWVSMGISPEMAINKLEPGAIYNLLARSLAVNFTGSFKDMNSLLSQAGISLE